MTLKECLEKGFIKKQASSPQEIKNLFNIVSRDLSDSEVGVTEDWKFEKLLPKSFVAAGVLQGRTLLVR